MLLLHQKPLRKQERYLRGSLSMAATQAAQFIGTDTYKTTKTLPQYKFNFYSKYAGTQA